MSLNKMTSKSSQTSTSQYVQNTPVYDPYGYQNASSAPTGQLTQSPNVVLPLTPEVIYETLFAQESVKRIGYDDFNHDTYALNIKECSLILFYGRNTESIALVKIFAIVAQQVVGPIFGACNLFVERKVAEFFTKLRSDGSHPLHWSGIRGYPFILVYRSGWPVAFYNGDRSVQAISDFSLTLACQANYLEPIQEAGGIQVEANYEMGPDRPYQNLPSEPERIRTVSSQYINSQPIRGYDPNLPVTVTGSAQAAQEASQSGMEQAQRLIKDQKTTQQRMAQEQKEQQQALQQEIPTVAKTRTK